MIVFQEVTKKYGSSNPVLDKVSFSIEKGNFAYLIGPTGSGKTTIFRLIIRDLLPSEGVISLAEWNLNKLSKSKVPYLRRRVGVVFQDLKLLHDRTVAENVLLPLEFASMNEKEAKKRVEEIISEVGLSGKATMFPAQLSGGERQRVAIARALVFRPEIILADEPTGNLDMKTSVQIVDLLRDINKRGTTVFMATHNDKLINDQDRVIVLEAGRIIEDKNSPKHEAHKKEEHPKEAHDPIDDKHEKKAENKESLESLAKK